jgi:hypothetical protein
VGKDIMEGDSIHLEKISELEYKVKWLESKTSSTLKILRL